MIDPDEVLTEALHDLAARAPGTDLAVNAARAQAKALIAIAATLRKPDALTIGELRFRTVAREVANWLRDPDFCDGPGDLWRREVLERLRASLDEVERKMD